MWILFSALFCIAVAIAAPTNLKTLTAAEGGNVTFWKGLNNQTEAILSYDNVTLLDFDNGLIRFRKHNILVENGSIVMTNVQKNSNIVYQLQIYIGHNPGTTYNIRLNVTERLHQVADYTSVQTTPHPNSRQETKGPLLAVILGPFTVTVTVTVALAVAVYWKRNWIKSKICVPKEPKDLPSVKYSGPHASVV